MAEFFGTDGFRGEAGATLTTDSAYAIGRFLGWYFGMRRGAKCRVVLGKDTRKSSYTFEYALAAGLTASGADAYLMHVTSTPSVAYAARTRSFDCGIVISASHNPFSDNGIKILNCRGEKLEDSVISLIEEYLSSPRALPFATGGGVGSVVDFSIGRSEYCAHLVSLMPRSMEGYKIGLDCANGAAYNLARSLFRALGAEVHAIGCRPDGLNINDGCGSTRPARLCVLVKSRGLDAGFAFDGDGDRCIAVDERGRVVDGDGILYILARLLKGRGEPVDRGIVATVMSNSGLVASLAGQGIKTEICGVGDRVVFETMKKSGCALGGEQSGHMILSKVENTGDGLVTALWILQAMQEEGLPLSALTEGLKIYPQCLISVPAAGERADCEEVERAVSRAAADMCGEGRILIRPSGTESVVRVMVEHPDGLLCKNVCAALAEAVKGGGTCAE